MDTSLYGFLIRLMGNVIFAINSVWHVSENAFLVGLVHYSKRVLRLCVTTSMIISRIWFNVYIAITIICACANWVGS